MKSITSFKIVRSNIIPMEPDRPNREWLARSRSSRKRFRPLLQLREIDSNMDFGSSDFKRSMGLTIAGLVLAMLWALTLGDAFGNGADGRQDGGNPTGIVAPQVGTP